MSNDRRAEDVTARLQRQDEEIVRLRTELHDAQMAGIAIGVLLARTPGWTERDALDAWSRACAELTRDGNTRALASYVMQTGTLPGHGVTAPV